MTVTKGQTLPLEIVDLAFGGKAVARIDGFVVFVDQAAPGDRVLAQITKKKKDFAEAKLLSLIEPSKDRVVPPCPYSGECGGCKWQFLDYERQIAYKTRQVAESLAHIGGFPDVAVLPAKPSERIFGYRNKMEFSCSDRRWLPFHQLDDPSVDAGFAVGLHVPGNFEKVLDIDACLLCPPEGNHILVAVKDYLRASPHGLYGIKSHQGFWRFLMIRHSVDRDAWLVNIVTAAEDPSAVEPLAALLVARFPNIASVVNNITGRKSNISMGEREIRLAGAPCLLERLGPFEFEISANSFFQTNTRGAMTLYDTVKDYAGLQGKERVLDLYSGTGAIPIWLSDGAAEVTGIELVESAVADARENCRRNGVDNCRFITGDIRRRLSGFTHRPDVIIIDPPRGGMHPDVAAQVAAMGARRIVYVSCNPATLARDAALMKDAYRLVEVQPVDMFPHTFHIEAVALLARTGA